MKLIELKVEGEISEEAKEKLNVLAEKKKIRLEKLIQQLSL